MSSWHQLPACDNKVTGVQLNYIVTEIVKKRLICKQSMLKLQFMMRSIKNLDELRLVLHTGSTTGPLSTHPHLCFPLSS